MATFPATRIGTILAVSDVARSAAFYREHLGFTVEASYDDPPYTTLVRGGVRLSFAEQGHVSEDRPGITLATPTDTAQQSVVLVIEVTDARSAYEALAVEGATFLAAPYAPPWGGLRFFVVDPDSYLVEIEQP